MPYDELRDLMLLSLRRAQALESISIVRDLYETEVDQAARALRVLIVHPDHWTGRIPSEVMQEITARDREAYPDLYPEEVA